jgi:hypothetical protein
MDFELKRLTTQEAWNNLSEMRDTLGEKHAEEVENMIIEAEAEHIKLDLTRLLTELGDYPFDFNFGMYDYLGIGDKE